MSNFNETRKPSIIEKSEPDCYRDKPIRYLGYSNEVGEAFRGIVHASIVRFTYFLSSGYVLADTIDKGLKIYKNDTTKGRNKRIFLSTGDTLLWQSFASVIVPGLAINRICATANFIQKSIKLPKNPWITTIIGLFSIPIIINPIDLAVEDTMNVTYRKWTGYHPSHKPLEDNLK